MAATYCLRLLYLPLQDQKSGPAAGAEPLQKFRDLKNHIIVRILDLFCLEPSLLFPYTTEADGFSSLRYLPDTLSHRFC